MADSRYRLTVAQAAFLTSVNTPSSSSSPYPAHARFGGAWPTVVNQSSRGTCVASAVAGLVACSEGCRRHLSVQYLDEVTRLVEQAWVEQNVRHLIAGEPTEKDFEAAFPDAVAQAALLVRVNGAGSETATAFVRSLGTKIRARIESDSGCRLKRCFEALEEYGVCREELWPYSPVLLNAGPIGGDAVGSFPPGTHEDARRHRVVNGLYVLRSPNNVDEIRGILAGARGSRPMPVCAGFELFDGCTEDSFSLPKIVREDVCTFVEPRMIGIHEVLIMAYDDDAKAPGGGWFTFLNSWGRDWGKDGLGKVSYAYVACFCREAGTILLDADDAPPLPHMRCDVTRRHRMARIVGAFCLLSVAISASLVLWVLRWERQATGCAATSSKSPYRPEVKVEHSPVPNDDSFSVEKIVDYRFLVRGECDSQPEARTVARLLEGDHREFSAANLRVLENGRLVEGEITVEGEMGQPPKVLEKLENYLERKKLKGSVRNLSVQRLR